MNPSQLIYLLFIIELILSGFWYTSSAITEVFLLVTAVLGCRAVLISHSCQVYAMSKLMLVYLAWLFIVAFNSAIPQTSMMTLASLANLPVIYLVASNTPSFAEIWKYCRIALFVMGVGLAIWAIWQVFNHVGSGQAVGPLVDRNLFAALMNVLWFPAAFLFLTSPAKSYRWQSPMLGAGLFLMSTALFATASRGGIATWLLLLPILLWAAYRNAQARRLAAIIPLIALAAYVCSDLFLHTSVADRTFQLATDSSSNLRLLLWQSTIKMTLAHPIMGTGWGTFVSYYPAFRSPLENGSAGFYAHNDFLQFAAEGGIPALLILFSLLLGLLFQLKRSLQGVNNLAGLESTSLLLGVLALFIHAGVNFVFYVAFTNILAGLYLARAAQLTDTKRTINISSVLTNFSPSLTNYFEKLSPSLNRLILSSVVVLVALLLLPDIAAELINKQSNISVANLVLPKPVLPKTVSPILGSSSQASAKINAYEIAKLITKIKPHERIAQEIVLRTAELALADSAVMNSLGVASQRELLKDTLGRFEILRIQNANDPNIGVRQAKVLIANHVILDGVLEGDVKDTNPSNIRRSNKAYVKAHLVLRDNLEADPYHTSSIITLARLQAIEGHRAEAITTLKRAQSQVFGYYNQQLIAIETLRQLAYPKIINELDTLEKQVRLIDSNLEADKKLALSVVFNEQINSSLKRIARQINPAS